ncbi:hypothetical protein GCM10007966_06240 [Legionella impletisoli]|uniref:Transmembrane protein n=1 Tax=Legionella impletisoli TaxID=343510 RepID=A0A917JQR0_9GAMM|nr:hypothetical protein [Legionella impletisoli]GGI80459.1 hypothetical protein GCM10007966_06240 [Legionella impletisoli]
MAWNAALDNDEEALEETEEKKDAQPRNFVRKYILGFPGLVIGAAFGVVGFIVAGAARMIGHTALTGWHIFAEITNLSLKNSKDENFGKDERKSFVQKYILGGLGLPIGAAMGLVGMVVVGVSKMLAHSAQTAVQIVAYFTNLALGKPNNKWLGYDERSSRIQKYALGALGLVMVVTIGILSLITIEISLKIKLKNCVNCSFNCLERNCGIKSAAAIYKKLPAANGNNSDTLI